nr:AlpA family phage regulatory protein [Phaeobacter marinintestinus]
MRYLSFDGLSKKLGGRSRSSIYRDVECGDLPKPLKIGSTLYWIEQEVDAHIARINGRRPEQENSECGLLYGSSVSEAPDRSEVVSSAGSDLPKGQASNRSVKRATKSTMSVRAKS